MCGINGIIPLDVNGFSISKERIEDDIQIMNNLISHRGPDSDGRYIDSKVAFGFRRLSIIDLANSANQPMLNTDGNVILIFNGEIYNYIELREELSIKGYKFKTHSDTEVILTSYLEFGEKCVEHFNGMWAFAIFDFRTNKLFCSRDRLGVKPFYYCINNNNLYISSELKSIHNVCKVRNANLTKVYEYLAYGYRINDGETFLENCHELLPGTNLIYENSRLELTRYWSLKTNMFLHSSNVSIHDEYLHLFEDAVKLRYRSDVPVALLLSGGLDSSAIAKVTDYLIDKGELKYNKIQAFIASFPGYADDETQIAREFVKTCKHIDLHEIQINPKELINNLERTIYDLDHPLATFASITHNNIMRECHKMGIKVVLNGQGSDEAFAGYIRHISGVHLLDKLISFSSSFFTEFYELNKKNNYSKLFLLTQIIKSFLPQNTASYLRAKYQEESLSSLSKHFIKQNKDNFTPKYRFSFKGNNFDSYLLSQINHYGLNSILHYEDVSSMNQSIEIRSPFMDYRLMEFAFSISNEFKFKKGITKIIQRDTIGKLLPDSITKNRKKIGFKTPFSNYIENDNFFKSFIFDLLNSKDFLKKGIWNHESILHKFNNPSKNPNFPFWRIINLEIWAKVYNISNL